MHEVVYEEAWAHRALKNFYSSYHGQHISIANSSKSSIGALAYDGVKLIELVIGSIACF